MAPERHAGGLTVPEEQRADVFSAGLTLCFLRTGRHLLHDQPDTAQQMINNHLAWNPANLDVLPVAIRPVIARALDYDPVQRSTAEELRAEIRRASATQAALRRWPTQVVVTAQTGNGEVVLRVADSGPGVDVGSVPEMFRPVHLASSCDLMHLTAVSGSRAG